MKICGTVAERQDMDSMISAAAEPVVGVLTMYIQAPGKYLSESRGGGLY